MPTNKAPEFLRYGPSDIVKMGQEQNLPPEQIAQGVIRHRDNLETWGREHGGDQYFNGVLKLDNDTQDVLNQLRPAVQRQVIEQQMPDPVEQQKLAAQLEKHDYDPSKLPETYQHVVQQAIKAGSAVQLPAERYYGGKVTAGGRDLAHFRMRKASDGMMDVGLTIPDPSDPMKENKALVRVPHATPEDVQAEIERRLNDPYRQRMLANSKLESPEIVHLAIAGREALKPLDQAIENLKRGGPEALMNERVREELQKPQYRDTIGSYAGGTEFYKGLETAGITSAALLARAGQLVGAPGADKTMRDLGEIKSTQDLRLGGSTRRDLEGGVWNNSVKGAQQSLGQMAPFLAGGIASRAVLGAVPGDAAAAELAAQQAGRLGAAGAGMSASATGGAELETQRKIDDAVARGDTATAERLRAGRDLHALLTGITEGAVERLGAAQAKNIFRGGVGHATMEIGKEGLEEVLTGGIQRAAVDPVALGEHPDVLAPMPQELLSGMMAAVPIAGGGAIANWNQAHDTTTNPTTAQPAAPAGAAPFNPFEGPINAPPQPTEAGGTVTPPGPQPVPAFQDDPFGTLARQPAGGNVLMDYGIQRTPEAQARFEQQQQEYADNRARAQGAANQSGQRMPVIPDNPLGYRDILDFVNENPLHIPRQGSEARNRGEYDWTQSYEMPRYYRRFLASSEGGHNADALAQMAFDEGYIAQPSPDALMEQIDKTIRERTQHRVEFRRQQQNQKDEERRFKNFDQAQSSLSPVESQRVALDSVLPGDEFTLKGENVRVTHVEHDEDGTATLVQIEDGKKFGVLNLDPQTRSAILVDEFKPRERAQQKAGSAEADPFLPRRRNFTSGQQANLQAAAASSVTRAPFGSSAAAQTSLLQAAYAAAVKGSSSMMVTIRQVYQAALRYHPDLKVEDFLDAVQSADHRNEVLLEVWDNPRQLEAAGPFVLKNASGIPSPNMAVVMPIEMDDSEMALPSSKRSRTPNALVQKMLDWANATYPLRRQLAAEIESINPAPTGNASLDSWQHELVHYFADRAENGHLQPWHLDVRQAVPIYASDYPAHAEAYQAAAGRIVEAVRQISHGRLEEVQAPDHGNTSDLPHEQGGAPAQEGEVRSQAQARTLPGESGNTGEEINEPDTLAMARPSVNGPLPSMYSGARPPGTSPPGAAPQLAQGGGQRVWSGKVRTLTGIRQFLLRAVGLPAVGVGRFRNALGIYRGKPESIRLQAINDIPVLAHEIGHALHYRTLNDQPGKPAPDWSGHFDGELMPLGRATSLPSYTKNMVRKEGVAEFIRQWLTMPEHARAAAPQFSAFFESEVQRRNPQLAEALREAQDMIADYVAMPAFEKAKAQIVIDPASAQQQRTWGEFFRDVYAKNVNTLQPALDVIKQAAEIDPRLAALAAEVEMWMENHRGGWAGKAGQDIFGQQTDLHGNVVGPGLQTILSDLRPGDVTSFTTYIALVRALEIERQGKRSGFENARLPAAEMQELRRRFEPTRIKLQAWMRNERNLLVQAGLLDAASAVVMDLSNADYVPFYRMYEALNNVSFGPEQSKNAGGYVDLRSGIHSLKGSDRAIIDPMQSAMKNAFMFRKLAEQNLIAVKFFDLVRQVQGHGQWGETIMPKIKPQVISHDQIVEHLKQAGVIQDESDLPADADLTLRLYQAITKPDTKNGEVIIFKNGKREHWQIKDALLMQALKNADADAVKLGNLPGWFVRILSTPARVLRWGATGGPWFAIPNFTRDQVQGGVFTTSGGGKIGRSFVPFWDAFKGGLEIMRQGGQYERWKQAGGEFSAQVTGTMAFTRMLEDALPKDPIARRMVQGMADPKAWRTGLRNALDLVGAAGRFTEQATRVGEFIRAKESGATDMQAANFSKTLSLNFARAGEIMRVVNQFIPFANANVQGLDQFFRMHLDPKTRGTVVLKGLLYITLPSLLCWALGKDDEEIQNLNDYRKNLFWNINLGPLFKAMGMDGSYMPWGDNILSIPKPFLLGAVYGTSVERGLDYATDRDPNGARKAAENILQNSIDPLEMTLSIAGLRPIIETKTNYQLWTGMPIVPQSYTWLPKEQQYNNFTSETAKVLGRWTGQSPMVIDHLLRGYFATSAQFGTSAIDYGMAKLGMADIPPVPRQSITETPLGKLAGFNRFTGSPYAASAFVSRFYEATHEMEGKLAVFNKQTAQMTSEQQRQWWQANGAELGWYGRITDAKTGRTGAGEIRAAQRTLSEINAAMKDTQASRVLRPDVKRARLIELSHQRNKLAEHAYRNLFPPPVVKRHW